MTEGIQKSSHQFVGIGSPQMNFRPRMSPGQAGKRNFQGLPGKGDLGHRQRKVCADAAGTAHRSIALLLAVQIDHTACRNQTVIKSLCAVQAHFFPRSKKALNRGMGFHGAIQHSQHGSHRHAVIRAERGSVCPEPSVFQNQADGILFKIMRYIHVFFAHHIGMALQQKGRLVFSSLTAVFAYKHIIFLIADTEKLPRHGKMLNIIGNSLFVARTARNRADFFKEPKKGFRLSARNQIFHLRFPPAFCFCYLFFISYGFYAQKNCFTVRNACASFIPLFRSSFVSAPPKAPAFRPAYCPCFPAPCRFPARRNPSPGPPHVL